MPGIEDNQTKSERLEGSFHMKRDLKGPNLAFQVSNLLLPIYEA